MRIETHRAIVLLTACALFLLAPAAPYARDFEESDLPAYEEPQDHPDSPGAVVEEKLERAGKATHRTVEHGAEPVGNALERAMRATGRGLRIAIEKTGEAFRRAGDAMTGD